MPLIRIVNHPVGNKFHVDKMIRIEGLPDKLMFYRRNGKDFLKTPWQIDVSENIPDYIKAVHQPSPFIVNVHTPSMEKGLPPMDEEIQAYGISIDFQNGLGEETWKQIERIIDQNTPRGERVPLPVIVAPDIDNDHRNKGFSIKADDIPVIHLSGFNPPKSVEAKAASSLSTCSECKKEFKTAHALKTHQAIKGHIHTEVALGV